MGWGEVLLVVEGMGLVRAIWVILILGLKLVLVEVVLGLTLVLLQMVLMLKLVLPEVVLLLQEVQLAGSRSCAAARPCVPSMHLSSGKGWPADTIHRRGPLGPWPVTHG